MKLLTIAVPCYNSEAYMQHCIDSLLKGGEDVEILIVNDGSTKDRTAEIADQYQKDYPSIVRAIHKENGGHGDAVNYGIREASGKYIKIVDSDDWVDEKAYKKILNFLRKNEEEGKNLDMLISNFVYEKEGQERKKVMNYRKALPIDEYFTWDDVGRFNIGQYILMHSVIYRVQILRDSKLELPKHTFYVDNIYVYHPLPFVKDLYYLDVKFYRYYIGREDQSVNEKVMLSRLDQQLLVNRVMFDSYDLTKIENKKLQDYMYQYLEIISVISSVLCIRSEKKENLEIKKDLWKYFKANNKKMYNELRYKRFLGHAMHLPFKPGRDAIVLGYRIAQKIFGFN